MYTLKSVHTVRRSMQMRRRSDVDLSDKFQEKLNIMYGFLERNNWRITISTWEELERTLNAMNRWGGCPVLMRMCLLQESASL